MSTLSSLLTHLPSEKCDEVSLTWDRIQRALDVAIVSVALGVWLPSLSLLLFLKLCLDGQPLLFHQVRVGKNGKLFHIHKIKTSSLEYQAQLEDWPTESMPPCTTFGRWLRNHDLDELPQLWNILKGEMSLVGPRPETPFHSKRFSSFWEDYPRRLCVTPGLTGLAQASGWRGDTSIESRLEADLTYVQNRGPLLYCTVLGLTLKQETTRWFTT